VVIGGIRGNVNLGRPVRTTLPRGPLQPLVVGDQSPPELLEVLVRLRIQTPLKAIHDLSPAAEDQLSETQCTVTSFGAFCNLAGVHAQPGPPPVSVPHQAAEEHGHRLRGEDVGRFPQQPGQLRVHPPIINGMAEFVQHGAHPACVGPHVGQHPDVAGAVHVHAEGVLVLPGSLVQVAGGDDGFDGESDGGEELARHGHRVDAGEVPRVFGVVRSRRLLKKPVLVVPGHQRAHRNTVPVRQTFVQAGFGAGECVPGQGVGFVEQGVHLPAILFVDVQPHRVEIGEPHLPRGGVA